MVDKRREGRVIKLRDARLIIVHVLTRPVLRDYLELHHSSRATKNAHLALRLFPEELSVHLFGLRIFTALLLQTLLAFLVVLFSLLLIRQDFVGRRDIDEVRLALLLVIGLALVRVVLQGEVPISLLDVLLACLLGDAEDLVEVPPSRGGGDEGGAREPGQAEPHPCCRGEAAALPAGQPALPHLEP